MLIAPVVVGARVVGWVVVGGEVPPEGATQFGTSSVFMMVPFTMSEGVWM